MNKLKTFVKSSAIASKIVYNHKFQCWREFRFTREVLPLRDLYQKRLCLCWFMHNYGTVYGYESKIANCFFSGLNSPVKISLFGVCSQMFEVAIKSSKKS